MRTACSLPLVLAALLFGGAAAIAAERPNVVLILTDDQGYGDLACLGNPVLKTPHLDQLYADSVRLTDFHVNPFCTPSRAALMTGRSASRTGAFRTSSGRTMLHPDETTMAELFRDNGYATGIFGKWHLGDAYPHRPQDRGFTSSLWHHCGGLTQISDYWGNDYFDDHYEQNGQYQKFTGYCTDVWFDNALMFIEQHARREEPFFCYLPTNAPHGPFLVAERYAAPYRDQPEAANAEFLGMIANIDENIGKLRQRLQDLGVAENTLLIYMTDNGTSAGVKVADNPDGWPQVGFNAGMRGKKGSMYDGGHRVPCFVHWPKGKLAHGTDVSPLTAHYDWLPTLMDLCDLKGRKGPALDGRSLAPLLRGTNETWGPRTMIRQYQGGVFFRFAPEPWRESLVMTKRWRLLNGRELYDIANDPGQRRDIAPQYPEVVERLRKSYLAWWQEVEPRLAKPVRLHAGNQAENPLRLTAQDWRLAPFGNPPTSQHAVRKLSGVEGPWMLELERAGTYVITLRQFPLEAPQPIQARQTWLRIAGYEVARPLPQDATNARFRATLPAGPAELETAFVDRDGKRTSAYFAEILFIEAAQD
ncbi:arylsulfatase [Lignipirellula cremea]|uniref:Arylsulfatase n=1 Tax=Lignipirellula cremea TaxID=2528010 RepID=A0A518DPQ6_9BACT|nr:arylsulfatase [Lignipirellula cremea]QDU93827.1 Arylsulfatase precursor [Lignipirellula cremea]